MAKEIADKVAKQAEQSKFWPVAATVTSCCILNQHGGIIFDSALYQSPVEGQVSYEALMAIGAILSDGSGTLVRQPTFDDLGFDLYGLRIRDHMRILALDALQYANCRLPLSEQSRAMLPVGIWNHRSFEPAPWCDPYEAVVPSELRGDIPWDGLATFLGVPVPAVDLDTDAKMQATVALAIASRAGLFSAD